MNSETRERLTNELTALKIEGLYKLYAGLKTEFAKNGAVFERPCLSLESELEIETGIDLKRKISASN